MPKSYFDTILSPSRRSVLIDETDAFARQYIILYFEIDDQLDDQYGKMEKMSRCAIFVDKKQKKITSTNVGWLL